MDFLFGADMSLPVRFFLAFVIVLALIGATAFLVRRFGGDRLGAAASRSRQPRLAVIDAAAVDGRRRLILIRRDNVEHLLMIGGPTDVVVEANIVRAAVASHAGGPRTAAANDSLARPVPLGEGNNWPLQPIPEPAPSSTQGLRPVRQPPAEDEMQWPAEPEPLPTRWAEPRPEPRAEPRIEPRAESRPEPRATDPLAGLAAELSRVQVEPPGPRPRAQRDPIRPRTPQPDRARITAPEGLPPNADQNLAEMAQRLEAALRRPSPPEQRNSESPQRPAMSAATTAEPIPTAAPAMDTVSAAMIEQREEGPAATTTRSDSRAPATTKSAPHRSAYDSLEQEMASLLGRPNTKT